MEIEIITEPTKSDVETIRDGLRQHNAPYLDNINRTELVCFTHKPNGEKSGGLHGEIWGDWLIIKSLWVETNDKGNGYGSALLLEAERYATEHGCHSSFLDTFSFQAKPFYEKHGYKVKMTLVAHPVSCERYYLTKKLCKTR